MTKNTFDLQKNIKNILNTNTSLENIITELTKQGARVLLVGGAVRDLLLGLPVKDLDIEVYNLSLAQLEATLQEFGPVRLVGKSFGVLRVDGLDVDFSLPRQDEAGRKPAVHVDPHLSYEQAFIRRDLTMNAMGIDLNNFTLIDPFGGRSDLEQKILRAPDVGFFAQDPLRLFRVMQFIGRFEMEPDAALTQLCKTIDIRGVSVERIEQEFQKLLLRSRRPALGIRWLKEIGRLAEILPELAALVDVPQRADYHPEGDVFEHTMQALDAAARNSSAWDDQHERLILMYAALCHDLGKAVTTVMRQGIWRSHGHAPAGVPLTQKLLARCVLAKSTIKTVAQLVCYHMAIGEFVRSGARASAYKRLAYKLHPETTIAFLCHVSTADRQGRNAQSHEPLAQEDPEIIAFAQEAQKAGVLHGPEQALITGKDLLSFLAPSKKFTRILNDVYEMQITENITDKAVLLDRIRDRL